MTPRFQRQYVRRMPKIYGNLQKPQRDWGWLWRTLRVVVSLGVVAIATYALGFSGWLGVRQITVEGANFSDPKQVTALVPLGSNLLFLSQDRFSRAILAQQPNVQTVQLVRTLPHQLNIILGERQPQLIWISQNQATILDDQGLAFAQYPVASLPAVDTLVGKSLANLPHLTDTKNLPLTLGQPVVSVNFLRFLTADLQAMQQYLPQVTVDHLEISDTTYDLTLVAKQGLRVQFNTLADPGVQVRNLFRLLDQKKASLTSQVDLRIDRWAYVQ